jgi:hydroxymethylpyrimidine/phosphomethylpyrimidine kinase
LTPRILIIAGSDSGGGAGIQADIKTVTMLGGHAMTAIAAITAQNTLGVSAVHAVPAEMVVAQIDAVADDIGIDAVKIGMIGAADTANAVADRLEAMPGVPVVFDPVMIASSGAVLADDATIAAFERLMRIATVITPNIAELTRLSGGGDDAARGLADRFGCAVLMTGGDREGPAVEDALTLPGAAPVRFGPAERIDTRSNHGTGCTLASAIAVGLARGLELARAIDEARLFVRLALREAPGLGRGHGPMGHQAVRLDGDLDGPVLNQVTVGVTDYAASAAFYRRLGLRQIVDAPPDYARFEAAGGGTLSIHRDPAGGTGATVYLECRDLDARVAELQADGAVFDHDPVDQPWLWREARLRDPHGTTICLYRAGEARRYPPWRVADA